MIDDILDVENENPDDSVRPTNTGLTVHPNFFVHVPGRIRKRAHGRTYYTTVLRNTLILSNVAYCAWKFPEHQTEQVYVSARSRGLNIPPRFARKMGIKVGDRLTLMGDYKSFVLVRE